MALAAVADLFIDAGEVARGTALLRDAALLGGATEMNLRRKELANASVRSCQETCVGGRSGFAVYFNRVTRKNKKPRVATVLHPGVIELIKRVTEGSDSGPLLPDHLGRRSTPAAIAKRLARVSLLTTGVKQTSNHIRDAGTKTTTVAMEMARRIGSTEGVALKNYRGPLVEQGNELVRAAMRTGRIGNKGPE